MSPKRNVELAAHIILATMDVLSTVFKTREQMAHVRVVGNATKIQRCFSAGAGCPSPLTFQSSSKLIMLGKTPLTMAQKLDQYQTTMQHIPVTTRTKAIRVHLSQSRLPKIT
jgi:hypothetical protein